MAWYRSTLERERIDGERKEERRERRRERAKQWFAKGNGSKPVDIFSKEIIALLGFSPVNWCEIDLNLKDN